MPVPASAPVLQCARYLVPSVVAFIQPMHMVFLSFVSSLVHEVGKRVLDYDQALPEQTCSTQTQSMPCLGIVLCLCRLF